LLRQKNIRLGAAEKLMELLSTHPNVLKRIKQLATYQSRTHA
jgi:Zn-dependent protease with chaperone function